jgi:hypothetical protein
MYPKHTKFALWPAVVPAHQTATITVVACENVYLPKEGIEYTLRINPLNADAVDYHTAPHRIDYPVVGKNGVLTLDYAFGEEGEYWVDLLLEGKGVFYLLILFLLVRIILIMISNIEGVTGGLFIPCLTIGATLGFLCGKAMIAVGALPEEYLIVTVVIGMSSYIAASSRIPLTALAFSIEVLSGINNLLPIALGVAVSYAVIEAVGIHDFIDAVIEKKIDAFNKGREMLEMDVELIVKEGSFVVGREVRDILWPPSCVIVSILHDPVVQGNTGISVGDLIRVHYRTTHPHYIARKLEELVGEQTEPEQKTEL